MRCLSLFLILVLGRSVAAERVEELRSVSGHLWGNRKVERSGDLAVWLVIHDPKKCPQCKVAIEQFKRVAKDWPTLSFAYSVTDDRDRRSAPRYWMFGKSLPGKLERPTGRMDRQALERWLQKGIDYVDNRAREHAEREAEMHRLGIAP